MKLLMLSPYLQIGLQNVLKILKQCHCPPVLHVKHMSMIKPYPSKGSYNDNSAKNISYIMITATPLVLNMVTIMTTLFQ